MNIPNLIKQTPLFKNIDAKAVEDLAANCHSRTYTKGGEIFAMGDEAKSFFVVVKGWVKLYRVSKEGEEVVINIFGPGESFAEAAVFNDKKMYPVSAQAIEEVSLIEIPRAFFIRKIETDTSFALRMLGAIASHQHYLVQQLEQVTTRTAPQRIGAFLLRFCQKTEGNKGELVVDLPYNRAIISTRLNIKPETFSRGLSKLEPYGVVVENKQILIKNITSLADFCDVMLNQKSC